LPRFVAGTLSLHAHRLHAGRCGAGSRPGAALYLTALMVGALAVSALTTAALAATEAGIYAQPHGEHDGSFVPQRDTPANENGLDFLTTPGHDGH
jgi:hypothetical protein